MVTKIFEEGPHSVRLGEEYDEVLIWILMEVLLDEKAKLVDQSWGMGGSQEITVKEFQIGQDTVKVRTETYMGTTLHGREPLVERIARVVKEEGEDTGIIPRAQIPPPEDGGAPAPAPPA